MINVLG